MTPLPAATVARQKRLKFKRYAPRLTVSVDNRKGIVDVDTVKGCEFGMAAHPDGGCYGVCYACKTATLYGVDFRVSVSRKPLKKDKPLIAKRIQDCPADWFRIGVMGDPSHDWPLTLEVCEWLGKIKTPVIVTKHWVALSDSDIVRLVQCHAVVNTSISPLDTYSEIAHRLNQFYRLKKFGVESVLRIVSCNFGNTTEGMRMQSIQKALFENDPVIDNPLRIPAEDERVKRGDILVERHVNLGGGSTISIANHETYVGTCGDCPDQCGVKSDKRGRKVMRKQPTQEQLFTDRDEYVFVSSVIGSGYESDVSKLAIEDGIAYRAARKNMQIHSAIILKVNGEFGGFFTFQNNDTCREFCLLQSVIKPSLFTTERYQLLVAAVIAQNTQKLPAIITTNPRSKFETPAMFESCGFKTYLKMSGFAYMVHGSLADVRMKLLAHITMCNVWNSVKGDWLRLKTEWNERIAKAGETHGIPNPLFATREGCWQGEAGFSNVVNTKRTIADNGEIEVSTKAHNGNASVLDPTACEVIARFFMPRDGNRIYNPFGGGVQFGYVAGACGFEYIASEIRQNQCDANNKLCSEFPSVKWIQSDSSTFSPSGKFDLVFTCPPYYRVEKYLDYNGQPPDGEINSLDTYEKFRDTLFTGYRRAIEHLNDNCFFVVMTGDSRDKNGAYHCSESETELFFRDNGLSVYNKIIYLECEFTRLAQAKKTLNHRKFPKREQKIIVAFKGDPKTIKDRFAPVGRL
jgi:hypothetical protein